MARGNVNYNFEIIRKDEREKALETVKKGHKQILDKMELVRQGKMRMVKVPVVNGFKLHFETIE